MDNAEVARSLVGITEDVLQSAVWQVKFWIPFELVFEGVWLVAVGVATRWAWRRRKMLVESNDDLWIPVGCVLLVAWFIATLVLFVGIPNTLSAIWNPTYWAVKALVEK